MTSLNVPKTRELARANRFSPLPFLWCGTGLRSVASHAWVSCRPAWQPESGPPRCAPRIDRATRNLISL